MKVDAVRELKKIAEGKPTKANLRCIAIAVLPLLQATDNRDDVDFLERLYRLEDPRV